MSARISIHCGADAKNFAVFPQWIGETGEELSHCPFRKGSTELQSRPQSEFNEVNERLQRLLERAPSDSVAELRVIHLGDRYRACLTIASVQNEFVSEADDVGFFATIDAVFTKANQQLKEWRRNRVLFDTDGV